MLSSYIDLSVLPSFLVAVLIILAVPGPDMAFMVASGVHGGRRAATRAAFGITAGVSVYVLATVVGLAALLNAAPTALTLVRLAGAGYVGYLAWDAWRSSGAQPPGPKTGSTRMFRRGFLVNVSNPKIALFFTAFLPQFLGDVTANPTLQLLVLGVTLQLLGLLVDLAIGWTAGTVRDRVLSNARIRRALERLAAAVYATLAVTLLVQVVRTTITEPTTT